MKTFLRTCLNNKYIKLGLLLILVSSILLGGFTQPAFAATGINKQINFQGKVVNANGTNVTNGNYSFVFSLYTVATGGTNIWTETKTITVTDGIFRTALGDLTAFPGSVDFNTDNIYLGINFNSDGEMTPRVQFTAVPQAFNALKVAGLTVTDTTGTFTLAAAKTLTVNNTLTFAGTDATTLTFQGTDTYVGRATTDTLTNKTIGTTGLIFSGATTDITTAAAEALVITPNGAATLTLGTTGVGNTTSITLATDSTGDAEVVLPTGSISTGEILDATIIPGDLNTQGTETDEFCLTRETTAGAPLEWQGCGGAASAWSGLTAPAADLSLNHAEFTTVFTFDTPTTAAAKDYFTVASLNDATTDSTTQRLLVLNNNDDAITTGATESLLVIDNKDANEAVTNAILIANSGGGAFTNYINAPNFSITNAGLITTSSNLAVNGGTISSTGTLTLDATSTTIIPAADTFQTDDVTSTGALTLVSAAASNIALNPGTTGDIVLTHGDGSQLAINATPTADTAQDSAKLTLNPTITGSTTTLQGLVISQSDNANTGVYDSLVKIENLKTPETTTNGLFIEQNATSGTLSNAINITNTAGALTTGLSLTGTFTNLISHANFSVSNAGNIVTAGTLAVNGDSITADGATLTINAAGAVDIQDNLTADQLTTDVGGVSIAASQSYTGAGAVTLSSGGGLGLTLDSASNTLTIGSTDTTLTASGLTTFTSAATLSFSGDITVSGGDVNGANSASIDIGEATAGALTFTAGTTGDFIFGADSDTNFQLNATPTTDATIDSAVITLNPTGTGSTGTLQGLLISQSDNANTGVYDSLVKIENLKTPETTTNGLFIQQNAASGTLTNALHINNNAGTLATAILVDGTAPSSFILDTGSIDISGAGAITGATGITSATGNVAITAGDLTLNGVTRISNTGVGTFITGSVLGSQTFTTNNIVDSGALTIKSGGTSALTLDTSGAAAINLGNTNATSLVFGNVTTNPTFSFNGSGLTTLGGGLTFSGTTARTITGPATGGLTVNTTSGPLTLSTTTSGTLAVTSAGALNLTGAAASTWSTSGAASTLIIEAGATTANTALTVRTANQAGASTNSGGLTILSGNAAGATSTAGNIVLDVGTSTTSNGSILIGTAARAQTINIGNSTGGVITIGASSGSGLALNDAQWSVTDAGAATFVSTTSPTHTGAGAVTLSSGGTSGLTFDSASGDITVAANDGLTFAATTVGNNGSRNVTINSGTGGTTATLIVKLDTSGTVVTTDTTTLNNAVGVATNTTTAGSAVRVAINGVVTATADNAVTAGDYIGLGTTTAGRAKSLGTTYPSTSGIQVIGRALGTQATPGSTFLLMLNGLDNNVAAGGGGGYNLIKDETTSLTARTTLAFLGTAVTCADNAGLTQTECTMSGAGGGVSFASGTPDNTATSNNLIHLQKSGTNRFVVANTGGLTINGTDSSVVRTLTTEFATGALLTNLTNANDQLELSDGTAGNGTITTAGQPVVNVAIGAGSQAITRANGKYQVIVGGGTAITTYDSIAGTFTASAQVLTAAAGAGALSLPRPDGRYRVIHGGGLLTTSLVDPNGVVAVGASVAVNASGNGTVAYRRANGRYLVTNGGAATTQIYNPVTDAFVAGPSTSGAVVVGAGALVLPRPDGQALIVTGGATNPILTTQLYNPNSAAGDIGVFAVGPVLPTGCGTNAAGSIAIRKQDGKYIVFSQVNASAIYDPVANTWAQNGTSCTTPLAGKGPTVALADGAHAIPMQDGKFLIIIGGASTVANIYDPSTDTFTAHATAITAGGAGRHSIMRANGTWQLIAGGGTATNNFDTSLPMSGTYQSDDISTTSLNASSTLKWTAQYEAPFVGTNAAANTAFSTLQFLVRTAVNTAGLGAASDREIITPGDFIRPGSTDAAIRMTVKFNRPLPKRIFDERGTWMGNGNTVTRLDFATPTLFDIVVDNSTVLRRNNFQFTEPNAQTAAPQNETSGPVATRVEAQTDRLYLPYGRLTPQTLLGGGTVSSGYYPGVISGAHPNLSAATTDGTIVIARPDRTFLVISAAAANASIYDPASSTFTAQAGAGNIPTAAAGTGAHAVKRPDGKFLVVLGGATTTTNIYDPNAASGSRFVAGPATIVAVGAGAHSIPNTDGTFTILHGGAALTTSIYDPVRNTIIAGPATPVAINCGSWAIPRSQYNHYLVGFGAAAAAIGVTTSSIYDANTKIFSATAAAPTLTVAVECGSFAVQRPDGLWWYPAGDALLTSAVYNPAVNRTAAGPAVVATGRGAHAIPRADGTIMIVHGNAGTATSIYVPWGGAMTADVGFPGTVISTSSPATQTAVGAGALSFQRPDGKWVIIVGGAVASAVTNLYDAGWYPDGQYLSEQVQVPALAANSTLEWKQTADNFVRMEVRVAASQAALGNAAYYTVGRPGQSIANAGGETWVQVEVNMRRDFPTFCANLDGVYASTGGMVYCNRNISTPTVFEYKLNNGMDLLNLQANGLNLLRVTSGGGIYSSATGGFYSGGADLAENYTSSDSLEKGEVVSIDSTNSHGVKRSSGQYQNNVLGVVSTAPGFVAGAYTDDSYPIALVGRVPVKVSTENGQIKSGDYLTSASIPGYAMKATMAGRVLGKALEPFVNTSDGGPPSGEDSSEVKSAKTCPAFGMGNLPSTKCGEVMMFVNLTDYLGQPVELAMAEKNDGVILANEVRPESDSGVVAIAPPQNDPSATLGASNSKQEQILTFLKELKTERESGSQYSSEVFTDRVSAVNEIISPQIVTDILYAKKIKADSIEGLEILTNQISKIKDQNEELAGQIAGVATASAGLSTSDGGRLSLRSHDSSEVIAQAGSSDGVVKFGYVEFENAQVKLNMTVLGKLISEETLMVLGPSQFKGNVNFAAQSTFQGETVFERLVTFVSNVIFRERVTFEEAPTFNKDTAGFAVIAKDTDEVAVVFEKEYSQKPLVTTSITLDTAEENFKNMPSEDRVKAQEALEKDIQNSDLRHFVTKRDGKGFMIRLNKKAPFDVPFSWYAIGVKDAAMFRSKAAAVEPTIIPSSSPSPSPTSSPTPSATIAPSITPSQEATPSAQ